MEFRFNQTLRMLAVAGVIGSLAACGGGGGGSPVITPPAEVITAAYKYQLAFVDAVTNAPITDVLSVNFTGQSVTDNEVLDSENKSVKGRTLSTNNGLLTVVANFNGSNDFFAFTGGNLALGWNTSGTQITRELSKEGDQVITIKLTNSKPAKVAAINADTDLGLAMATGAATASATGVIASNTVVTTAPKTVTNDQGVAESVGTAKITIPANTVARDANGVAASGALTLTVTKYSNNETQSLQAFPGGFTPTVSDPNSSYLGAGVTEASGNFITGGFAQFNVTDSTGKAIKKFDTPVTLTIDLPKTSKNPETGALLKSGDTYPIWSFDETTGKWAFEQNGTIREKNPVDANNFEVVFSSNHLSYWNLDWLYWQAGTNCDGRLNITGRPAGDTRALYVDITGVAGTNYYMSALKNQPIRDSVLNLARSPRTNVNIKIRTADGVLRGSANNVNLCGTGATVQVNLPTVSYASLVTTVTESCPDGSFQRPSPTSVWLYTNNWLGGYTSTGTSTISNIESGTTGTLWAWNRLTRQWVTRNNVAINAPTTSQSFNFNNLQCTTGGITGAQ